MRTSNLKLAILAAAAPSPMCLLVLCATITLSPCFAADFDFLGEEDRADARPSFAYAFPVAQDADAQNADEELDKEVEDDLYGNEQDRSEIFPEVVDGHFDLPTLAAITTDTSQIGNGKIPDSFCYEGSSGTVL